MEYTKSQEEYIKAIYILQNMNEEVRITDVANKLNVTKPSVTRSVKKLADKEILNYKTYGSIYLTEEGKILAKNIIKKQDTMTNFLYEILGVDLKIAEKEASILKSALSQDTINKIEDLVTKLLDLGNGCDCPGDMEKCKNCIKHTVIKRLKDRRKEC